MNNEPSRAEDKSEPDELEGGADRGGEDEPVLTTPAGRFWEIALPPETEAALRVRGL